jgi:hypothetical protein
MESIEDRKNEAPGSIVYAVLLVGLDGFKPGDRKSVQEKNPQPITKLRVYYIGQTSRPFEVRYQQHLTGIKAGRGWIQKYKQRPVPLDEGEADFGRGAGYSPADRPAKPTSAERPQGTGSQGRQLATRGRVRRHLVLNALGQHVVRSLPEDCRRGGGG